MHKLWVSPLDTVSDSSGFGYLGPSPQYSVDKEGTKVSRLANESCWGPRI